MKVFHAGGMEQKKQYQGGRHMAKWFVTAKKADFNQIAADFGIDPVTARLIRNRDVIGTENIRQYLRGELRDLHDPRLLKDMDLAVEILRKKIAEQAGIRILGDYDADGICATYILYRGLTACGAEADTVIPHRIRDGYGINEALIREASEEGRDTIITCDNGVAAAEQIALANALGLTVIVTDHHEVPYEELEDGSRRFLLPPAAAVVNPKQPDCRYPYKGICGAAVAYKLVSCLAESMEISDREEWLEELVEIAAFATVCDVMELREENRILVRYGLEKMKQSKNLGLRALMAACQVDPQNLKAYQIGFVLGPCINATGRLDTAQRALTLFGSRSWEEAFETATQLKTLNEQRKDLTQQGLEAAIERIESSSWKEDRVLVVYLPELHESLAGIIAGRLRERYWKPVFVLTNGEEGVKGSGRSIDSYHMYDEMTLCNELFTKYGGHKMAAGLSMKEEDVDRFREKLNQCCRLTPDDLVEKLSIDVAMPISYLTEKLVEELELLEPFGTGNQKPVFAQKDVHIISGRIFGKNRNVGKYRVTDGHAEYEMVYFGDLQAFGRFLEEKAGKNTVERLYHGERVDIALSIAYYPEINTYRGNTSLQIRMTHYSD